MARCAQCLSRPERVAAILYLDDVIGVELHACGAAALAFPAGPLFHSVGPIAMRGRLIVRIGLLRLAWPA
jgi:hypothetical protein